jgi:5-methylcytosine-specific restriction endonuclease McrA
MTKICKSCGNTKPLTSFAKSPRSVAPKSTRRVRPELLGDGRKPKCNACCKYVNRRNKGRPTRAEIAIAAESRRETDQRSSHYRQIERLLRRLLERQCAGTKDSHSALLYRARYRNDPTFRAAEITRRQLRDYTFTVDDGTLTAVVVRMLFADAVQCPYCGRDMNPRQKTLDHIVPRSRGGMHSLSNAVVCCLSCNSTKHDRLPHEWQTPVSLAVPRTVAAL